MKILLLLISIPFFVSCMLPYPTVRTRSEFKFDKADNLIISTLPTVIEEDVFKRDQELHLITSLNIQNLGKTSYNFSLDKNTCSFKKKSIAAECKNNGSSLTPITIKPEDKLSLRCICKLPKNNTESSDQKVGLSLMFGPGVEFSTYKILKAEDFK